MPASVSLSIPAIAEQVGGLGVGDPARLASGMRAALAQVQDPRKPRGVRHRLVNVLVVAVCAVAAGARSFVAVAEWVADLPAELAEILDVASRRPSESTIRRLLGTLDADRFDAVIGAFVQRLCAATNPRGRRRVLALDGKTLRGSRYADQPGRHLLSVIDHHARVVLGQLSVSDKTNEITAFAPLLDTLTSIDLTGVVLTADALHTQRDHVEELHRRGAHWLLTVKGNQPTLRRQLAALPWKQLQVAHRSVETGHGRREIRTIKVVTIAEGIAFPHAAQAVQITRKTRPLNVRAGNPGRWRTETVYAITDLPPHQARPDELATWIRGHWQIESLHWIRDVTFGEDLSQVHAGNAPQVWASLRNLVISLHRLNGATNIAAALRHHARSAARSLQLLKII